MFTFTRVAAFTSAEANAFATAHPMRAAIALANVQYVLAEMEATETGAAWSAL